MQLTFYNGSPRGKKGNTEILIRHFLMGFETDLNSFSINYLIQQNKMREFVGKFQNSETIILAFPLYTDSMPGIVKEFIEALEDVKFYTDHQRIGFLIHCGFPEATHLRAIERYLKKLSQRLGIHYLGTIVKGGSEGLRVTPEKYNKKLFLRLQQLGSHFSRTNTFDEKLIRKISGKEKFPRFLTPLLKLLNKSGLFNIYWNRQLKKNKALDKRYEAPYKKDLKI